MTVVIVAGRYEVRAYCLDREALRHLTASIELHGEGKFSMCSRRHGGHWDVEIWCCDGLLRAATICHVAYVYRKPGSPTAEWAPGEGPQVIDEEGAL